MNNKKHVLWGAGKRCEIYLSTLKSEEKPELIIDNDLNKSGLSLGGISIVSPNEIEDYDELFITITTAAKYEKEIMNQLSSYGLVYGRDFETLSNSNALVNMDTVEEALIETFFEEKEKGELYHVVYSKSEYDELVNKYESNIAFEKALSNLYRRLPGKAGVYKGYCVACEKNQLFSVSYLHSNGDEPAWRETVVCPECFNNSRMRFSIEYILKKHSHKYIYCYEASTVTFKVLSKKINHLIGSEFLGEQYTSGDVVNGILHEDAMNLSFEDNLFDVMCSFDVFEHVADYKKALMEAHRCLKTGGELIVSIPLFKDRYDTVNRTKIDSEGNIEFVLPPMYHANPIDSRGSLVFNDFGWDIIDTIKSVGFTDVHAVVYSSVEKGYMGKLPILFVGRK